MYHYKSFLLIVAGLVMALFPLGAKAQLSETGAPSTVASDLSGQYESVLMRTNGTVTVLATLGFWTTDQSQPISEFEFEIPAQGAQKVTVHHGYSYITYCTDDGNCNNVAENIRDTGDASGTSHATHYEKLTPIVSGKSYKVSLGHLIKPDSIGSFLISYELPKALKGRNKSFNHQIIKTKYQPKQSAIGFVPDTSVLILSPNNPDYRPLPIKLQKEFEKLNKGLNKELKASAPKSAVAALDVMIDDYNSQKNETFKHGALQILESSIKSQTEEGKFTQKGSSASAKYSMGGPSLWQRIVGFFANKKRAAKENIAEKKATIERNQEAVLSLFQSEVPDGLDFYRTIYGHYPQTLADLKKADVLPLVSSDPQTYLVNAGLLTHSQTYQARLDDREFEDPLTYESVDSGKNYRLCLKEPVTGEAPCFSRENRPSFSDKMIKQATDQESKDFYKEANGKHFRDAFRETSINMIGVHLLKFFEKHQKFPDTLIDLTPEFPQFMRTEVLTDPLTQTSHPYKTLSNGQDFELCLQGESVTDRCFNKASISPRTK